MLCSIRKIVIVVILACQCLCDISNNIYHKIPIQQTNAACYRLLNGTHQFGCHSPKGDGKGVVVHLESDEDISGLQQCFRSRFPRYTGSFFLLLDTEQLDRHLHKLITDSKCVSGVILTDSISRTVGSISKPLSHDSECPNLSSGFYNDGCDANRWNNESIIAGGLRNVDWTGVNIIYLGNQTHVDDLLKCHDLFNRPENKGDYPLCAAAFDLSSSSAGNTEICIRRSKEESKLLNLNVDSSQELCNALEGKSVVAFLPPNRYDKSKSTLNSKYMLISAKVDSFGLIPEVSPSEISVLTSVIATLAMAKAMGKHHAAFANAAELSNTYIVMALFNGEAFEYIGSSYIMHQIQNGKFPYDKLDTSTPTMAQMDADQIELVLEVQQIGVGDHFRIHVDNNQLQHSSHIIQNVSSSIREGVLRDPKQRIIGPDSGRRIPPSSWHSVAKVNSKSVGIVLAPFDESYTYNRINSILDSNKWDSSSRRFVSDQITAAAKGLLYAAADYVNVPQSVRANLEIDREFVETLFDCFVISPSFDCKFLNDLAPSKSSENIFIRKNTYIGVNNNRLYTSYLQLVSIYATGTINNTSNVKDSKTCRDLGNNQKMYSYTWLKDPLTGTEHCYRHSVFVEDAISPAFLIPDYDFKNSTYSTWTETLYEMDELKLYLLEKSSMDVITITLGLLIALLSYLFTGRCNDSTFIIDEGELAAEQGEPL